MTGHPLRPATRQSLGRPSPHQQADRPRAHPPPEKTLSTNPHAKASEYPVLAPVSGRYPKEEGRLLTCYSPVRHSSTQQKPGFSVRLACVKHAASVRPEPGSNSPNKNKNVKAQKNQPNKTAWPAIPTKNTQKQKTGINKTNKHTIEFTNNTHTIKRTQMLCMFSKGVSRHVSAISALRFVRCRSAQQGKQYALPSRPSNRDTHAFPRSIFRRIPPFWRIFRATKGRKLPDFMLQHTEYQTECALRREDSPLDRGASCTHSQTITFFALNFTNR